MAITDVLFLRDEWSDSKDGSRSYTRHYDVYSNDPNESMVAVRLALPLNWTADTVDGAAIVVSRRASRDEEIKKLWHAEVEWAWGPTDLDKEESANPVDHPPTIRGQSRSVVVAAIKDINGEAILNSAGEYYDPPPEKELYRWVSTIQFALEEKPANMRSMIGRVNSTACIIDGEMTDVGRAKIVSFDVSEHKELQITDDIAYPYRDITVSIEILDDDEEDFDLRPLDQGLHYKDVNPPHALYKIQVLDSNDEPVDASSPQLLDGAGGVLADPNPGNAKFMHYDITHEFDFTIFPGVEPAP